MSTPSMPQDADEAARRVKELSDRLIELTKKNGISWLEAYENILNRMIQLQERASAATQIEWINTLAATNADFMREMSAAYFQTARDQLK
jgi:beta-galactosidase/beta-glucuronidase